MANAAVLVWVAACGSKDASTASSAPPVGSGSAGSAAIDAGAPMDADAATMDTMGEQATEELPTISEGHGLVLTDPAGGTLAMTTDDGKTYPIADGTLVELSEGEWSPGGDEYEPKNGTWQISVGGKRGKLASANVVIGYDYYVGFTGEARSPNGQFQVVAVQVGCGDFCHVALWLLNGPKRHWIVADDVVGPVVAWRPDNGELAYDHGGFVGVVELPSGKRRAVHGMSPAYAPSGTLYVRGGDAEVFEVAGGTLSKVGQGKKPRRDPFAGDDGPAPVAFDAAGHWQLPHGEKPARRRHNKTKPAR